MRPVARFPGLGLGKGLALLVLGCMGLQLTAQSTVDSLPDAPSALVGQRTTWHELKTPAPKHHNWFYRHPVLVGLIAGGTIGGVIAIRQYHTCPSVIDGYGYQGTPPCPNWCGPHGCTWPSH